MMDTLILQMILKVWSTYGRGFKYTGKTKSIFSTLVSYQTFQGWDWLGSYPILNL